MDMNKYSVYSFADIVLTVNHPKVGQLIVTDEGGGRIVVSNTGDLSSHTTTATGYTVVNKLRAPAGTLTIEVAHNSEADKYLKKLIDYVNDAPSDQFALTTIVLNDPAANCITTATGCTPQKKPERNYDAQSSLKQYVFLAADITET